MCHIYRDEREGSEPMAKTVTMLSTCIVKPTSPSPPHHMFLSAADSIWRWFRYNQRNLFFKLDQPLPSPDFVISHLKASLASVLVEFFPWAGRVFKQEDGHLALDCNDAGVPFIEAYIDMPFSSLENDGFQYQPFFKQFAPHGDIMKWDSPDVPLLSVQVTRFSNDEGFVLGIGHSHIVADGSSLWHFMKSWGEFARGVPLSLHPIHMREALRPEKLILPPPLLEEESVDPPLPEEESVDPPPFQYSAFELVQRDFHFTSEMVRKLKQMATSSCAAAHTPFSSLQALGAHMWKHVIAATDIDKNKECIFYVVANMRSKLDPPLPEAYFGNAIIGDGAVARKEEIVQESLGATALRIQEVTKTIDDNFMRTFYGNFEVLPFMKLFDEAKLKMFSLQVSGSPRFPVYEVDFGWGPPLCVRTPHIRSSGEMIWVCGPEGRGSIDVSIALSKPVMERLEEDQSLRSF